MKKKISLQQLFLYTALLFMAVFFTIKTPLKQPQGAMSRHYYLTLTKPTSLKKKNRGLAIHIPYLSPEDPKYKWMDEQIKKELSPFSTGISKEALDNIYNKHKDTLQRYAIHSGKVYGPKGRMKNLLKELALRYDMPDVDFLYLHGDGFTFCEENLSPAIYEGPIFASAKNKKIEHVLYFADWYFDPRARKDGTFDWCLLSKKIPLYNKKISWQEKENQAVWRGYLQEYMHDYSPNGFASTPRGKACLLALSHPYLIDAGIASKSTSLPQELQRIVNAGFAVQRAFLRHKDQLRYKYIIDIDGHTCTYPGLQWKMLSNSTLLKQETENAMWFFSQMKPWQHYVPLREDLSDLEEKIRWCQDHDMQAKKIADDGAQLATDAMMPEHCLLYCYKVLIEYAKIISTKGNE